MIEKINNKQQTISLRVDDYTSTQIDKLSEAGKKHGAQFLLHGTYNNSHIIRRCINYCAKYINFDNKEEFERLFGTCINTSFKNDK